MSDAYYSSVALLLHGNGTNGSTTFVDNSPTPKTVTANGNAQISNAQSMWGGSSMLFDGAGDTLSVPYSSTFDVSGDATIEAWIYRPNSSDLCIVSNRNVGNINYHLFCGTVAALDTIPSGGILSLTGSTTISTNAWHHVAATKEGNTWRLFLDGNLEASGTVSGTYTATGVPLIVGASAGNYYFNGYIEDLRITAGVARYTASFTAPTAEFDNGPPTCSVLIAAPHPTLLIQAGAAVAFSAPPPAVYITTGATVSLACPPPILTSHREILATASLTGPSPTLLAASHDSTGEHSANLIAPSPVLTITTGASAENLRAPSPTLDITGIVTSLVSAATSAPSPTLSATGTVSGMASAALGAPSPNLIGYSGAVCSIALTGSPTLFATGTTGGVASVSISCPLFELTSTTTVQNYGSANLIAPAPTMGAGGNVAYLIAPGATLTAIGHAAVTATYEAYAVNLKHQPKPGKEPVDEVTRYTNFPFTHIVRYKNSYFGANSTGLYLLDGTTDYATPTPTAIPWAFKTAMTDFKSQQHKTVASAYFGGRLGAAATIDLHVGEDGPQTYSYATVRTDHAQNYRQVFGKGTKARYYALGASGTGTLELDDIDLDVHTLSRRI